MLFKKRPGTGDLLLRFFLVVDALEIVHCVHILEGVLLDGC